MSLDVPSTTTALQSNSTAATAADRVPQQTLNQNDFLQLLVAQLSAQDPLNPVSDTEFVGQMAQFSTLQQTQAMQQNVAGLQASNLLGKTVVVQASDGTTDGGVVSGIAFKAGTPSITVNGKPYTLSQILSVSQPQS